MGGMRFIHRAECEILRNNALINIHRRGRRCNSSKNPSIC
jgi:hypothetical protein